MEKIAARVISYIFHPLIMTTLGMFIIFNSGTSLSVIQPQVARISLIILCLFTCIIPAMLVLLLYYTKVISDIELKDKKDRFLVLALVLVMYLFSYFILRRIPQLNQGHAVFLLCSPTALLLVILLYRFVNSSLHLLGLGMITGLIFVLIVYYEAPLVNAFNLAITATGLVGTSRMILNMKSWEEVGIGYFSGILVTLILMLAMGL